MKRIGLAMEMALGYNRRALMGIKSYARAQRDWSVRLVSSCLYLDVLLCDWMPDAIIGHIPTPELAQTLLQRKIPVITLSAKTEHMPVSRVCSDNRAIGRMAAHYFLERGLRHFAFAGSSGIWFSLEREAGFCDAVHEAGFQVHVCRQRVPTIDWVNALPRPFGLLVFTDEHAQRVVDVCVDAGLQIPEHAAIIGVDNDEAWCNSARVPLSSVDYPAERIGFEAAGLLHRILEGDRDVPRQLLIPPAGVMTRLSSDVVAVDDPQVAEAVRFIKENASKPINVEDILGALAVSRRSLEKKFLKALQRTPLREIHRVRIERTKHLLSTTQMPLSEVARQSGFPDSKQMFKLFRHETGTTPAQFRQRFSAPS